MVADLVIITITISVDGEATDVATMWSDPSGPHEDDKDKAIKGLTQAVDELESFL